jgi:cytochrome c oxidase subunit IV
MSVGEWSIIGVFLLAKAGIVVILYEFLKGLDE